MRAILDDPKGLAVMRRRCRVVAPHVAWQHEERKYVEIYSDIYEAMLFEAGSAA